MKIYCMDESCPNKIDGCSFCTVLMKPEDCPKRKVELPCKIGDLVRYTDEYESFDFEVTAITTRDKTRIYGGSHGCIVYAEDFDRHCKVIASANPIQEVVNEP